LILDSFFLAEASAISAPSAASDGDNDGDSDGNSDGRFDGRFDGTFDGTFDVELDDELLLEEEVSEVTGAVGSPDVELDDVAVVADEGDELRTELGRPLGTKLGRPLGAAEAALLVVLGDGITDGAFEGASVGPSSLLLLFAFFADFSDLGALVDFSDLGALVAFSDLGALVDFSDLGALVAFPDLGALVAFPDLGALADLSCRRSSSGLLRRWVPSFIPTTVDAIANVARAIARTNVDFFIPAIVLVVKTPVKI